MNLRGLRSRNWIVSQSDSRLVRRKRIATLFGGLVYCIYGSIGGLMEGYCRFSEAVPVGRVEKLFGRNCTAIPYMVRSKLCLLNCPKDRIAVGAVVYYECGLFNTAYCKNASCDCKDYTAVDVYEATAVDDREDVLLSGDSDAFLDMHEDSSVSEETDFRAWRLNKQQQS